MRKKVSKPKNLDLESLSAELDCGNLHNEDEEILIVSTWAGDVAFTELEVHKLAKYLTKCSEYLRSK